MKRKIFDMADNMADNQIEKPLRYKKLTGGLHYTADGRKIKKGEIFSCLPSQMPKSFAKSFECLDKVPEAKEDVGMRLEIKPAGKNTWNLINSLTGLPVNSKPMTAQQAKSFLDDGEKLPREEKLKVKPDSLEEEEEEYDD